MMTATTAGRGNAWLFVTHEETYAGFGATEADALDDVMSRVLGEQRAAIESSAHIDDDVRALLLADLEDRIGTIQDTRRYPAWDNLGRVPTAFDWLTAGYSTVCIECDDVVFDGDPVMFSLDGDAVCPHCATGVDQFCVSGALTALADLDPVIRNSIRNLATQIETLRAGLVL